MLAGLVILPVLPNREMGSLGVLNPFAIWLMVVVIIVGISLAAYLAGKFLGGTKGAALGGLISSTATTASLARRSRDASACGISLAAITLIASAGVFLRVIVEVIIAAPAHLRDMLPPLVVMMLWFAIVAFIKPVIIGLSLSLLGGVAILLLWP